mgnify:CR=1 FL=1
MRIEEVILRNLVGNEEYTRKVVPFLSNEYFHDSQEKVLFEEIAKHITKYNGLPTKETLLISLDALDTITEDQFSDLSKLVSQIDADESKTDEQWLLDETEKFCKDKALYNAIMRSINIIDDKKTTVGTGEIPAILSDALSVSFDPNVGHDYIEDSEERYDFYHRVEERIPFDLDMMNRISKGGLPNKSLNIIMAGTGVGKSLFMCHCAGANMLDGKNVLYITLEMAEERIAERIDANLLDMDVSALRTLSKDKYIEKVSKVQEKTVGKLIVKEYPTAVAGVGHFRHLLNELNLKKSFKPDIIYVDYLNICASGRIKPNANINSYTLIKAIAEELRGLAVENNLPVVSATQTTRSGFSNTDVELTDTAESFGLPATADFMVALVVTEELEEHNQMMVKQLKNRYNDPTRFKRFIIGVDRERMKLFDVEDVAQEDLFENETSGTGVVFSTKKEGLDFEGFEV